MEKLKFLDCFVDWQPTLSKLLDVVANIDPLLERETWLPDFALCQSKTRQGRAQKTRWIRGAIWIRSRVSTMNIDGGTYMLSHIFDPLFENTVWRKSDVFWKYHNIQWTNFPLPKWINISYNINIASIKSVFNRRNRSFSEKSFSTWYCRKTSKTDFITDLMKVFNQVTPMP